MKASERAAQALGNAGAINLEWALSHSPQETAKIIDRQFERLVKAAEGVSFAPLKENNFG